MRSTLRRWDLIGQEVLDAEGARIGKVMDTYPSDGGGEVDLLLVHVGRAFPRRRWLPMQDMQPLGEAGLLVRRARWQIEDAPDAEDLRWGSPPDVARAYWLVSDQ